MTIVESWVILALILILPWIGIASLVLEDRYRKQERDKR